MDGKPDKEWDAGDLGCGELVLQLSQRLKELDSGQVLKLKAKDPGALEDLPAWCKLTGHKLLVSAHPEYWIQKKTKG
jgi:tRNA 2-thiouridine synthesizing protein A